MPVLASNTRLFSKPPVRNMTKAVSQAIPKAKAKKMITRFLISGERFIVLLHVY